MEWLAENWNYVLLCVLVMGTFFYAIWTKRANAKEWLKWAVTEAEKALGTGTGQAKLRMVYDMFVKQFPWFATFIPFSTFSYWVDEALEWMRQQLETNENFKAMVEG
jgi:hypothetical protein